MKAKYTKGPPELVINAGEDTLTLLINVYTRVPKVLEDQLSLPARVKEYGIKFSSQNRGNDQ